MVEATKETLTKINLVDHAFRRLRCCKAQLCSSTSKQRTFFASDSEHLGERGAWRIDVEKSAYHQLSQCETKLNIARHWLRLERVETLRCNDVDTVLDCSGDLDCCAPSSSQYECLTLIPNRNTVNCPFLAPSLWLE
jgi:hypothetical protein